MVEYENICRGVMSFNPPRNKTIKENSNWLDELAEKLAEYNNVSIEEAREYIGYDNFRALQQS